ncbi:hypothetical protein CU097_014347 [Rhizopus azygosporus]|uniref:Uncharacterized protein n=1 Tax=Rhizopus azygosporus TaxID=86630 RepID=A0A367K0N0_RHIAZ|nr:hypothetical protein CU097_014347 [Rhizopus azygosporus]
MIPGVWNNTTERLFADGVGCGDGFEVIIMESSGPLFTEDIDHFIEDTWKLITMTTNSLRNEILEYQDASIEAVKGLAVFRIQYICGKITSATIPVTWDSRTGMMSVFELLTTLQNE